MGKGALNIVVPFLIKSSADSEARHKNKSTRAYQKEIFCGPIYASISVIPEILSGYLHGNLFFKPISEIKLSRTVDIPEDEYGYWRTNRGSVAWAATLSLDKIYWNFNEELKLAIPVS